MENVVRFDILTLTVQKYQKVKPTPFTDTVWVEFFATIFRGWKAASTMKIAATNVRRDSL